MTRIAIVAGESSGDLLGSGLIRALREQIPDAEFYGIGGPAMIEAGFNSWHPMEKLSVMGFAEVLKDLPTLLKIRKHLRTQLIRHPPDVFIGIDAPDFNLPLEARLKKAGIKTVHYVSPSVWAWRQWRVKKIAHAVDLILTLFPFEADFYREHDVDVAFVGHPLADMIPLEADPLDARSALDIPAGVKCLALLPGSRMSEVERLGATFLRAALQCQQRLPGLVCIAPMVNQRIHDYFMSLQKDIAPNLSLHLYMGKSREIMLAADVILLASGTAALEAMLLKKPMVVAYKLSPITYWIIKKFKMMKVAHYSLPNLLAKKPMVPELMQEKATSGDLATAVLDYLEHPQNIEAVRDEFEAIHGTLRRNASVQAARAIASLMEK